MQFKSFVRSLVVTSLMSFLAPLLTIGGVVIALAIVAYVPGLSTASQAVTIQVLQVLSTFGSGGDAIEGAVVIGFVFMLVGALFDTYSFYSRYL